MWVSRCPQTVETYFVKEECVKFLHDVIDTSVFMSLYLSLTEISPEITNP